MLLLSRDGEVQWVVYIETTFMLYVKVGDVFVGVRRGKEVIPSCGLFGTWCPTCVIVGHLFPLMCLASYIDQLVSVQCLLQGLEGGWVTIEITYNKSGSCRLQTHVI